MSDEVRIKNTGLRGVTVADSGISFIDGEQGILIYRGYRIEDLADRSTYLETALEEIRNGRGTLYHAESVDACLRLIEAKKVDLSAAVW